MNSNKPWKIIGKVFKILGIFCIAIGILIFFGSSGFLGFDVWQFSLNYYIFVGPLFFISFIFYAVGSNAARIFGQSHQSYEPYSKDTPTAPEYHSASTKVAEVFGRTRFILQENTDLKDTLTLLDPSMKTICYAKHQHSWKTPYVSGVPLPSREMRTTDIRFEGVDGVLLGEIHELPPNGMRVIKRWQIFDDQGKLKGTIKQKPKLIGNDWILENDNGKIVVTIDGILKKHSYNISTGDRSKQAIASCSVVDKNSFGVDIMLTTLSPFLVLSFIIVLELSTMSIITRRGWNNF